MKPNLKFCSKGNDIELEKLEAEESERKRVLEVKESERKRVLEVEESERKRVLEAEESERKRVLEVMKNQRVLEVKNQRGRSQEESDHKLGHF